MTRSVYGYTGVYNLTPITLNDGEGAAAALNSSGQLIVALASGSSSAVTGNVASGATDSGNPIKIGGVYNTTPPTLTNGQRGDAQMDANADLLVALGTILAGEDLVVGVMKVEQRFSYLHIAAGQATTVVKAGSGFLHSITLNGAATATNVTTVYDNTAGSGTVISIPAATTATVPTTLTYDVTFLTGLTIVTATANGADMTISYR